MEAGLSPKPAHATSALPTGAAAIRLPTRKLLPVPLNHPPRASAQQEQWHSGPCRAQEGRRLPALRADEAGSVTSGVRRAHQGTPRARSGGGGGAAAGMALALRAHSAPTCALLQLGGSGGAASGFKPCWTTFG